MKKMIVSDFDDTLYVNKKISDDDLNAINDFRNNSGIFIIASGSSFSSLKRKIGSNSLNYDYLITDHGANVFKNDELISSKVIPCEVVKDVYDRFCLNQIKWNINYGKGYFLSSATEGLLYEPKENITKIHLDFESKEKLEEAINYLNNNYKEVINYYKLLYHNDIEIISKEASKLISTEKIRKENNVNKEKVYVIGDGNSDLEMIKEYNGYAMSNALDSVKKACEITVKSVGEMIRMVNNKESL